jgi:large subunit ribosomal protein L5
VIFPEISPEKVQQLFGFQITIVTTAHTKQEGEVLFRAVGMPLQGKTHNS